MSYTFVENLDKDMMDTFVLNSEQNNLFQQSSWAEIKQNWSSLFVGVKEGDKLVASGLVLKRKLVLGYELWYLPRGPILDYKNKELVQFFFDNLKVLAKKGKAIEIKFDPNVFYHDYAYKDRKQEHANLNEDVIETLKNLGAKHRGFTTYINESIQPRFQAAMDIACFEERLESKTKKYIRQAGSRGVYVTEGADQIADFSKTMHMTEEKKNVALRNEAYFKHMQEVYGDKCFIIVARIDVEKQLAKRRNQLDNQKLKDFSVTTKKQKIEYKQMINEMNDDIKHLEEIVNQNEKEGLCSGLLGVYNDNLMELFYMGNNPNFSYAHASYQLYYYSLKKAEQLGIKHCSFGGIEGTLKDGLTIFKSNWPMDVEEFIGEFDIPINNFMYTCFDKGLPIVKNIRKKVKK